MKRIATYKYILLLVFTITINLMGWSQNVLHRNNYFIQEYLINPAFTGSKNFNPFYLSYRRQFSQLSQSPQVFSASGYFIVNSSSNFAGSIYSSRTPSFDQLFGEVNYSHDYHFSQWAHFTFGGGLILNQTTQNFNNVENVDFGDPSLILGNRSESNVDASLGFKYFLKKFKTGLSIKNILQSNLNNEALIEDGNSLLAREINFIAQYDFTVDSLLHIEPLFVARRFTQRKENYYNFSIIGSYNNLYTFGATYRLNNNYRADAIAIIGGLQYNNFYFLYSHQLFVASASIAGNNSEVTAGYRFPLRPSKIFVDNDLDGVINKKDTCPDVFGPKKYSGCPLEFWAPLLAMQAKADADTLILDDSLMFRFDKLNSDQANNVKLYLLDNEGNIIYQAMKTEDGFIFNYLPPDGKYYFKMENIPEELGFEYLEISFLENDIKKTMLAHLTQDKGVYMFSRIISDTSSVAKLLIINDDNQVLAVGIQKDGVFVFNHLPEDKNYHYSLVESDSTISEDSFHVSYDFEGQENTIRTIYHKINGLYKYSPHFMDDGSFDDLALSFENETEEYIFNFKKLTSEQAEKASLVMVDADGNILSTAVKTENGFEFTHIPTSGEYFYKLENMPEGTNIEFMEIDIVEDGLNKKVVASVDDYKNVFTFQRLNSDQAAMGNLVIVDADGNVLSTAEKTDGGFVFNKLPSSGEYFYKLENMPEGTDIEFLEVTILEDGVEKKIVADVNPKESSVKLNKTDQKIMSSLRALNSESIKSMTKSEARKRGHYLTVQVGAFRFRMNDETLEFININYGDDFHIIKDKRLEYDLYMLGRYKTLEEVKAMNIIIKEAGFSDCFIMGVEKKDPASALKIIRSYPGYR